MCTPTYIYACNENLYLKGHGFEREQGRGVYGKVWRGWKKNGEREEKERGKEGEKEKARETERKRRLYLSTSELSTNTKPDPKTQS